MAERVVSDNRLLLRAAADDDDDELLMLFTLHTSLSACPSGLVETSMQRMDDI